MVNKELELRLLSRHLESIQGPRHAAYFKMPKDFSCLGFDLDSTIHFRVTHIGLLQSCDRFLYSSGVNLKSPRSILEYVIYAEMEWWKVKTLHTFPELRFMLNRFYFMQRVKY